MPSNLPLDWSANTAMRYQSHARQSRHSTIRQKAGSQQANAAINAQTQITLKAQPLHHDNRCYENNLISFKNSIIPIFLVFAKLTTTDMLFFRWKVKQLEHVPQLRQHFLRPLLTTFICQRSAKENIGYTKFCWDWRFSPLSSNALGYT